MPILCAFILSLFMLVMMAVPASAKEGMNWFRVDIPPVYIINKGEGVGGFGEGSMRFVMEKLSQYRHTVTTMNLSRGLEQFKEGKHLCFSTLLVNDERKQFVEFSIPSQLVLPLHLAVRMDDMPAFQLYIDKQGEIDLDAMLADGENLLGIASGRSYSSSIDEILNKYRDRSNVYSRPSMDVASGLIHMLQIGRVDCILEFPVTVGYTLKKGYGEHDHAHQKLVLIPIKGMPKFFQTRFAAPKNEWGKKVISEINQVLKKYRTSHEFMSFYSEWLTGETKERYESIVRETFAK